MPRNGGWCSSVFAAIVSGIVLAALYLMAAFAPFLSPHDPNEKSLAYREAPPQRLHFFSDQGLHLRPFVYPFTAVTNRESFKRDYLEDRQQRYPLRFFVRGYRYQLLFLFESDIHLFGTGVEEVPVHLIGTDHLGRDMLARVMYGAQISLSVGLVGVAISFLFGHSDRRAGALARWRAISAGGWTRPCNASWRCCCRFPSCRCGWDCRRRAAAVVAGGQDGVRPHFVDRDMKKTSQSMA